MGRLTSYRPAQIAPGEAAAQSASDSTIGDKAADLLKRIPGEVVALYVAADSALQARLPAHPVQTGYLYGIAIVLSLVGMAVYYRKLAREEKAPFGYNFGMGLFAFIVWLYATAGGGLEKVCPFIGDIFDLDLVPVVLLFYGFIAALIPAPRKTAV